MKEREAVANAELARLKRENAAKDQRAADAKSKALEQQRAQRVAAIEK